jgi:hypothetical protein
LTFFAFVAAVEAAAVPVLRVAAGLQVVQRVGAIVDRESVERGCIELKEKSIGDLGEGWERGGRGGKVGSGRFWLN